MPTKKSVRKASKSTTRKKAAIAVGVGALVAAGAAAYFLTGKRGEKNRKAIKSWMVDAHEELARALKQVKKVTQQEYAAITKKIIARYKHLDAAEVKELAEMLRQQWRTLSKK